MRILCIIDCLGSGGAQRQMTYLACGLKQRGHDVELFLTHPGADHFRPEIEAAGIPIHGIDRGGHTGFSWRVLVAMCRLLHTGFDGILSYQLSANGYAVLARVLSGRWRVRVVSGERTSSAHQARLPARLGVWGAAVLATRTVANSCSYARHLRQLPLLQSRVDTVWNGYPVVTRRQDPAPRRLHDPLRLLVVARQSLEKNALRLVLALKVLRETHGLNVELQWAGRAEPDTQSEALMREVRQELGSDPELSTHCHWLGEVTDVLPLYQRNDALILPSLYEGLPNAVCEAMLAGCPVIASNVCDNPLLLGQEERGLLCDPLSVDSIVDAILRFTRMSSEDRNSMATRARTFAEQRLGLDTMVSAYEALLLGGRGQPDAAV